MMAVVLSHQLVSVLMFGVIVFTLVRNLTRKDFIGSLKLIVVSLPALLYFFIVYLSGVMQNGFLITQQMSGPPCLAGLVSVLSIYVK